MKKFRPVIAAAIALLFYALTDILIWQRIFEANEMVKYADIYHAGWFASLAGYALMGTALLWGSWKDCLYFIAALFVGAFSGLEDMLYYILDRKMIPATLPWLSGNPMIFGGSRLEVIGSALFWLTILVIFYVVLFVWHKDQPQETLSKINS